MKAIKEITKWDIDYRVPNHTYLIDGEKAIAYKPWHDGDAVYFDHPLNFSKSYRKFEEVDISVFVVTVRYGYLDFACSNIS